jgi:hypothetical protein
MTVRQRVHRAWAATYIAILFGFVAVGGLLISHWAKIGAWCVIVGVGYFVLDQLTRCPYVLCRDRLLAPGFKPHPGTFDCRTGDDRPRRGTRS